MEKKWFLFLLPVLFFFQTSSQNSSFIVLGDIHYDLPEFHDMVWLGTKPDDLRQVTQEYTVYTATNWPDFMLFITKHPLFFKY